MAKKTLTSFDQVVRALRTNTLGPLGCSTNTRPTGTLGERTLSFSDGSVDRTFIDDSVWLADILSRNLGFSATELLAKKIRDEDGEGQDCTILVGNITGDPSTHWAIGLTGFVTSMKHFDPPMDIRVMESERDIKAFISRAKNQAFIRAAEHMAYTAGDATDLDPKKLLALRDAFAGTEAGQAILRVWDSVAISKDLEATTPKARKDTKSPRL